MFRINFITFFLLFFTLFLNLNARDKNTIHQLEYKDQWGNVVQITGQTKWIIYIKDMESQKKVRNYLENQKEPQKFLDEHQIVIIANIYKMPTLIKKYIAIPRMQKYSYKLLLVNEDNPEKDFPFEQGKITVIKLNNLIVEEFKIIEDIYKFSF